MAEHEIQGTPAPPETKSWFEYSWKLRQDVPNRFEDAAKFLTTIIGLTLAIASTALDELKIVLMHPLLLFIVLVFWLIALLFAFLVLFPHRYQFHSRSIESIKQMTEQIGRTKQKRFVISTIFYFIPLLILVVAYLISILAIM